MIQDHANLRHIKPGHVAVAVMACLLVSCGTGARQNPPAVAASSPTHMPGFLNDPAEPVNRGIWAFNHAALEGIVHPVGKTYRTLVPEPARASIGHAGANVLFPARLINELLQGRWKDAGDDTLRFFTNSTAGVGGFFDVATRWNMPRPQADFSQTFQSWGWKPQTFIMLPLIGPSDQSSAVASLFNRAADPLFYIADAWPASAAFSTHRITDSSGTTVRMARSQPDPYSFSHLAWSYFGRHDKPDWTPRGSPDMATLETMAAAAIRFEDPGFPDKARVGRAHMSATGRKLPFNYWMQRHPAPLAYVMPGLGSHRYSGTTLTLAEHLFASGFSVVAMTSAFHPEFMENASTSPLPGRLARDSQDVWNAMAEIDAVMTGKFPSRITRRAMVGASMGGYMALILATNQTKDPRLQIDRFLAINPPVDLMHGIKTIDTFYQAPVAWPAAERQYRIDNSVHKVGGMSSVNPEMLNGPPFDGIESKYLIGLNFRFTLRDVLYNVEKRHHLGLTSSPPTTWNRQAFYREALGLSFADYAHRIMIPHYRSQGMTLAEFQRNRSLHTRTEDLRRTPGARIITNRNDFLLRHEDIRWMRSTFGSDRLSILPSGGHLGNIASPQVRAEIVRLLDGMQ